MIIFTFNIFIIKKNYLCFGNGANTKKISTHYSSSIKFLKYITLLLNVLQMSSDISIDAFKYLKLSLLHLVKR